MGIYCVEELLQLAHEDPHLLFEGSRDVAHVLYVVPDTLGCHKIFRASTPAMAHQRCKKQDDDTRGGTVVMRKIVRTPKRPP